MNNFYSLLKNNSTINSIQDKISSQKYQLNISGISSVQKSCLLASLYHEAPCPMIIVGATREELKEYRRDLSTLLPDVSLTEFYPEDFLKAMVEARSREITSSRLIALNNIYQSNPGITFVTVEAFLQKLPAPKKLGASKIIISNSDNLVPQKLLTQLVEYGYSRVDMVDSIGEFSVRGGIIDIYPINFPQAIRIEFFADEVDSIRLFDAQTQLSVAKLEQVEILPVTVTELEQSVYFFDFFPEKYILVLDETLRIKECAENVFGEMESEEYAAHYFSSGDMFENLVKYNFLGLSFLPNIWFDSLAKEKILWSANSITNYHRQINLFLKDVKIHLEKGLTPLVMMSNREKCSAMVRSLSEENIPAVISDELVTNQVNFLVGDLSTGFHLTNEQWLLISEKDIFTVIKRKSRKISGQKINYFTDIKIGDYVVHDVHGIAKYIGVENIFAGGVHKDYLVLQYAGTDQLCVPIEQVNQLNKYVGNADNPPKLSRMGGAEWTKTRAKAKSAITELAVHLLNLYAERKLAIGHAFAADSPWQKEFEDSFEHEETPDQLTAIEEIKADMEASYPMDRLLCGDVGYGKTEVAIRAAFKAVLDGKQVAVLVPTTILSEQHYKTFCERFDAFGVKVDIINRFRSTKEKKKILSRLHAGEIDILVGTHSVIQADIIFKNLGLLIIDEEQRFGVAQKEKIKNWWKNIDVLCLSATPIPRSLHMSLVSARDISIIDTPPADRLPIKTYVAEYNEDLIREAIAREMRRGGQVYFVHNRIQSMDSILLNLNRLVPEAKIRIAHGRMNEATLENALFDFYEEKCDVLLCTSIAENGLDVPNANTIIINDADYLGLAQLYQMRGRVGRSSKLAYAYLLYRKNKVVSELAEKRLRAIQEFTELGAGFKISMRDLEIRGSGNILGAEQHGHLLTIGFETYSRLLAETMEELKYGKATEKVQDINLDIAIDNYLPDEYIADPANKLYIHKRIIAIEKSSDSHELLDELIDRFGDPPQEVLLMLRHAVLRAMAISLKVKGASVKEKEITIVFGANSDIEIEKIVQLTAKYKKNIQVLNKELTTLNIKNLANKEEAFKTLEDILLFLTSK